jgi:hypothetical protein
LDVRQSPKTSRNPCSRRCVRWRPTRTTLPATATLAITRDTTEQIELEIVEIRMTFLPHVILGREPRETLKNVKTRTQLCTSHRLMYRHPKAIHHALASVATYPSATFWRRWQQSAGRRVLPIIPQRRRKNKSIPSPGRSVCPLDRLFRPRFIPKLANSRIFSFSATHGWWMQR